MSTGIYSLPTRWSCRARKRKLRKQDLKPTNKRAETTLNTPILALLGQTLKDSQATILPPSPRPLQSKCPREQSQVEFWGKSWWKQCKTKIWGRVTPKKAVKIRKLSLYRLTQILDRFLPSSRPCQRTSTIWPELSLTGKRSWRKKKKLRKYWRSSRCKMLIFALIISKAILRL